MVIKRHRISVRVMLAGVTLFAIGRFVHDARGRKFRGAEPEWMAAFGA